MTDLIFDRDLVLTVGSTEIRMRQPGVDQPAPTLRVQFRVTRTNKREPNEAQVTLYNLSRQTRVAMQEKDIPTRIVCGYVNDTHQIFLGDLDYSRSTRQGTDWVTTLQSSDGGQKIRKSRVNVSLRGPAKVTDALRAAADALGLEAGNLRQKIQEGGVRKTFDEFTQGIVLSGKADQQLDKIVRSLGLTWSSQDGQLILLGPNETISQQARVLGPRTGLVGSPEPGDDGRVRCRSLLLPDLTPNNRVKVESEEINGFFKVEKTTYTGDTWGNDWYADLELIPVT